jgi:hypothetical protein
MTEPKMVSFSFFVDSEAQVAEVIDVLAKPIAALVLDGKRVHISMAEDEDDHDA